jgi:hypothetical protein
MILEELLKPMTHEATLQAYEREKTIRKRYGEGFVAKPVSETIKNPKAKPGQKLEVPGRIAYNKEPGKDIYGNEKSTSTKYFECPGCKRKVASSRLAAHIERCLSGRNARKNKGTPDSSTASPKKRKASDAVQPSQFLSVPVSRSNTPAESDVKRPLSTN